MRAAGITIANSIIASELSQESQLLSSRFNDQINCITPMAIIANERVSAVTLSGRSLG